MYNIGTYEEQENEGKYMDASEGSVPAPKSGIK